MTNQNTPERSVTGLSDREINALAERAYKGQKPDGLSDRDELLYWRLYEIYQKARSGEIDAEQGGQIKKFEILKYKAKLLRAERINQILKVYAGATESKDDGMTLAETERG